MGYVFISALFIKANSAHEHIILVPPLLINGNVTPVRGSRSVIPKTFRLSCTSRSAADATAAIE